MHVCMLCSDRFPGDERLKRQAGALREAGHTVTVCARGASDQPDRDVVGGIDVRRVPDESLYSGLRGKLDGARYALGFVHPAWLRAASEADDERGVDVCCVRDLSLVKTGLTVGETLDVPVVCDLPGPTDAGGTDTARGGRLRGLARRAFHPSWRRNRLLTHSLPDADRLVTTCEEARAEYLREKGLDPQRVAVVRDTADAALDASVARGLDFDPEGAFVVTAFADDASDAELETVIEAASRTTDGAADLRLMIVGALSQETVSALETLARQRLVGGRVAFHADADRTAEYIAASDVCVFPDTSQTTAVPPALFEAMAMGVPVVVSDGGPLRRIITRTNAGRTAGGKAPLTEALIALADAETAAELGANGRRAVEHEFNWDRDTDRLLAVYESLTADESAEEITTAPRAGS